MCVLEKGRGRERERERERDRLCEKRERDLQTDRQTERERERESRALLVVRFLSVVSETFCRQVPTAFLNPKKTPKLFDYFG